MTPRESEADVPDMFFVATAIKACYGALGPGDSCYSWPPEAKKSKSASSIEPYEVEDSGSVTSTYQRLYDELRDGALSDVRKLTLEHVGRVCPEPYRFMKLYSMCQFEEPRQPLYHQGQKEDPPRCLFTGSACSPSAVQDADGVATVAVYGIVSPLTSARAQPGELYLTRCQEGDYDRSLDALTRLKTCRTARPDRRVCHGDTVLGNSPGSMEHRFELCVRKDLHAIGCLYRQLMLNIELLHLNILHFIHS